MKILNLIFLLPLFTFAQVFVDADASGMNNGSSWTNAYTDLQNAIQNASIGEQIWVAEGIYFPSQNGYIDSTFKLNQSIDLYGGFAGTETVISERNFENNITILSGDYNNDDNLIVSTNPLSLSYNNYTENSKRLIFAQDVLGSIVIDGFTISGGSNISGSAMYFSPDDTLDVLIKNCIVKNNKSASNGAIFVTSGTNEKIHFRLENSSTINNYTTSKGGAVFATGTGETVVEYINILFHQNFSANRAGAVNHEGNVTPTFQNCIFSENRATNGGAIFELQSGQPKYTNCTFYKNTASSQGSVIFNYSNPKSIIENCIFYANGTNNPLHGSGSFEIANSLIEYNNFTSLGSSAVDLGGNLYNLDPQFIDEANFDFNLSATSPMINAGNNTSSLAAEDFTGYIFRIVDNTVDLGAFEYHLEFNTTLNSDTEICFGENGSATITADNYAPFTYLWNTANVQGANPTNLPAGNIEVTVENAIGDFKVHSFTITELPEILATSSVTDPSSGNTDGSATVTASGGTAPLTYEWNTTPLQTTETVSGLQAGTYTATITDGEGCQKVLTVDVGNTTSIFSMYSNNEIKIGPNPLNDKLQIVLSESIQESSNISKVKIYNTTGKVLYSDKLSNSANTIIHLNHLANGIYFIELSGENELKFVKQIIKQ